MRIPRIPRFKKQQRFSKCIPWTSSMSITSEFFRNSDFQNLLKFSEPNENRLLMGQ